MPTERCSLVYWMQSYHDPQEEQRTKVKSVCCELFQIVEQRSDVACFACGFFLLCMLSHRIKLNDLELYVLFAAPLGLVLSVFLKCNCGSLIRELLLWSFLQYFPADAGFQVLAFLKRQHDVPVPLRGK